MTLLDAIAVVRDAAEERGMNALLDALDDLRFEVRHTDGT